MIKKLILGILLFMFIFTGPVMAKTGFREANVTDLYGTVNIKRSGGEKTFPAFNGMSLNAGDRIMTGSGSWIMLNFDSDKEVKIDQNTDIVISEISFNEDSGEQKTGISLWAGRLWASIKRGLGVKESFEVKTPTTVMGVKGTMFYVDRTDQNTVIAVLDGRVYTVVTTGIYDDAGNYIKSELELMLEKNEKLSAADIARSKEDLLIEEVVLEDLDLFILEELVKNLKEKQLTDPESVEDILVKLLDQIIDVKKAQIDTQIIIPKRIIQKKTLFEQFTETTNMIEQQEPVSEMEYSKELRSGDGLKTSFGPVDIKPGKYEYLLTVSSDTGSIKITPSVEGTFTQGTIQILTGSIPFGYVNNGEESGEIALSSDDTMITIIISEPSRLSRIYRLKIVKEEETFVFTDEFDTETLNEVWSVLYPNYEYLSLAERSGHMAVILDQGDLFHYPDKTTKNIFTMDPGYDDFSISSKVSFSPVEPNGQAGIIIYSDEYNFFAITRQYDRAANRSAVYVMSRYNGYFGLEKYEDYSNISTTGMTSFISGSVNDIYFKIIKEGKYCTAYYSYDSVNWVEAFLETPELEFSNPKAAFYASGNDNYYNHAAYFDFFTLTNDTGAPEDVVQGSLLNDFAPPFVSNPAYVYAIYSGETISIRFNEAITYESRLSAEEQILASLSYGEEQSPAEYIEINWDEYENDRLYYVLTIKNINEETFYFFDFDVWADVEDMAGNTSEVLIISPQAY